MAKILITGGAGFIGSSLAIQLIKQGHNVAIVDDLSTGKKDYVPREASFYKLSILSKKLDKVFQKEQPEFVYHLAAQIDVRVSVSNPDLDNSINVLGGLRILENCYKYKVKKIIFTSSGGAIYGDASEIPTSETYLPAPVSPYGINKLAFEKYLRYYFEIFGQKYISLRFANVYGPRQFKGGEAGVVAIFCHQAVNGQPLTLNGDGSQTRDFVYIDDIVKALIVGMDKDYVGELNIGSRREVSILDVVNSLKKAVGKDLVIELRPAAIGEQQRSFLDVSLVEKVLGWRSEIDLEEGIKRTFDWSKDNI